MGSKLLLLSFKYQLIWFVFIDFIVVMTPTFYTNIINNGCRSPSLVSIYLHIWSCFRQLIKVFSIFWCNSLTFAVCKTIF